MNDNPAIAILDLFAANIARYLGQGALTISDDAKKFNEEYTALRAKLEGPTYPTTEQEEYDTPPAYPVAAEQPTDNGGGIDSFNGSGAGDSI